MSLSQRVLLALFHGVTQAVFHIHNEALERVPARGPLIIVMNHVQLLEIPLIYAQLQPRPVRGLVLAERWKNPLLAWGLDTCRCIPLRRGGINIDAFHQALDALKAGEIVIIMPEGTRSYDGRLQQAHPGVVLLAAKSKAPLLPIVTFGGENYKANLKKLRRTDFHIAVGEPFSMNHEIGTPDSQSRQQMLDEIMHRMAALLPPAYRGAYG
jgi:1-acyl-sn-glycerol-3-phosphate acyltransferase